MQRILVICTGNSARSQMAEGILKSLDARLEVHSAGTQPAARVHPFAVRVMREIGIDISAARPKSVDEFARQPFDYVITVCEEAGRICPSFAGAAGRRLYIGFPDPAAATGTDAEAMAAFRKVRDEIRTRLAGFYNTIRKDV